MHGEGETALTFQAAGGGMHIVGDVLVQERVGAAGFHGVAGGLIWAVTRSSSARRRTEHSMSARLEWLTRSQCLQRIDFQWSFCSGVLASGSTHSTVNSCGSFGIFVNL